MAAITNISAVNFRAAANYQTPVKPETKEYNVQDKEVTNKYLQNLENEVKGYYQFLFYR